MGRVYFDVPLNLAQLDADVDVQDKFYSISQCIWHCTTKMLGPHRYLRISLRPTEKGSQPKREVASVQVYHDSSRSTPRQSAGVIAVELECVIRTHGSNKTSVSVTILEYRASYLTPALRINNVIRCRNNTLQFLKCSWERAPRTTILDPIK